jgi:DNA-binding transcriptional ArsR family regulator
MPDRAVEVAGLHKLFADATRVRICRTLAQEGNVHVGEFCDRLGTTQPAVSHHLSLLRAAGVVEGRREGKYVFYSLSPHTRGELAAALLYPFGLEATKIPRAKPAARG